MRLRNLQASSSMLWRDRNSSRVDMLNKLKMLGLFYDFLTFILVFHGIFNPLFHGEECKASVLQTRQAFECAGSIIWGWTVCVCVMGITYYHLGYYRNRAFILCALYSILVLYTESTRSGTAPHKPNCQIKLHSNILPQPHLPLP